MAMTFASTAPMELTEVEYVLLPAGKRVEKPLNK
jgi:hypothetical protein